MTPPWWSISLLSSAALAYEVLLTRLFAIIQWHHFAYTIIRLALLGYGASGSFLALLGTRAQTYFQRFFTGNAVLFGLSSVACFLIKILGTLALIAPLAFCMGIPFPLGLSRLISGQIPWAWAINGASSTN